MTLKIAIQDSRTATTKAPQTTTRSGSIRARAIARREFSNSRCSLSVWYGPRTRSDSSGEATSVDTCGVALAHVKSPRYSQLF